MIGFGLWIFFNKFDQVIQKAFIPKSYLFLLQKELNFTNQVTRHPMIQLLHANPNKVLTIKVDILTIETALIDNHMHPLDILFQSTYLIPHNFILLILLLKTLNLLG